MQQLVAMGELLIGGGVLGVLIVVAYIAWQIRGIKDSHDQNAKTLTEHIAHDETVFKTFTDKIDDNDREAKKDRKEIHERCNKMGEDIAEIRGGMMTLGFVKQVLKGD